MRMFRLCLNLWTIFGTLSPTTRLVVTPDSSYAPLIQAIDLDGALACNLQPKSQAYCES